LAIGNKIPVFLLINKMFSTVVKIILGLVLMFASFTVRGQAVPSPEENIPWLITFGNRADMSWGDNDFSQIFFFLVPETYRGSVYLRIFDPDVGGMHDEVNGANFTTRTRFSVYGGREAYSHPETQKVSPKGNFRTGTLLVTRVFGVDPRWDNNWFTFGPFDPTQGEFISEFGGYVFKLVCEGIEGNDGNVYRYFMSSSGTTNVLIEGGNAFTFEYTFRLHETANQTSHIYPFVDLETTSIRTENFDWDDDGIIRVTSEVRRELSVLVSGDAVWAQTDFIVLEGEKGKSLNFQFIPKGIRNNNVVINVRNQRGENLKFYSSPIGGVPRYRYTPNSRQAPR